MTSDWATFIVRAWPTLLRGQEVLLPSALTAPRTAGFRRPLVAEPHGQAEDWVLPLRDHSRLHVHVYPWGERRMHRDRIDPARSPVHAVLHLLTETRVGAAGKVAGAAYAVGRMFL